MGAMKIAAASLLGVVGVVSILTGLVQLASAKKIGGLIDGLSAVAETE